MAETIEKLSVELEADAGGFTSGLASAASSGDSFVSDLSASFNRLSSLMDSTFAAMESDANTLDLGGITAELDGLEAAFKDMVPGGVASAIMDVRNALDDLESDSGETDTAANNLRSALGDLKTALSGVESEINSVDTAPFVNEMEQAEQSTGSFVDGLTTKFSGLGGIVAGAGTLVGGAFIGIGVASFDMAGQVNQATNDIQAQLGYAREDAEAFASDAVDMFGNNFGSSIEDVTAALVETRLQMKGLGDSDIQAVAENAIKIRDVFGIDIAESTNAANTLMSEFGLTSEEAMNFLTTGFQRGLNTSGDFLDTIGEYSNQFSEGGATAEEFFSTLETGMAGGMLGTDKVADSFKEFRIRMTEGSEDVVEALNLIGSAGPGDELRKQFGVVGPFLIDTEEKAIAAQAAFKAMGRDVSLEELLTPLHDIDEKTGEITVRAQEFGSIYMSEILGGIEDGSLSVMDAQKLVIDGLGKMDNKVYQNTAGVALMGTQWEDMGAQAILGIDTTKTGLDDMNGATDTLNAKYNSLGTMFSGVWRKVQTEILLPIGQTLLDLANTIMPYVEQGISAIGALLSGDGSGLAGMVSNLGATISAAAPQILATLGGIATDLLAWISGALPGWLAELGKLGAGLVQWALDALPGLLTALGTVLTDMINWVVASLPAWGTELGKLGAQLLQWVSDSLPGLGTKLGEVLGVIITWIGNTITTVVPELLKLAGAFLGWIATDVLPALPGKLGEILLALGTFLGNVLIEVAPKLAELGGKFINWITDEVLPYIGGKLGEVWDAITGWISTTATNIGTEIGKIYDAIIKPFTDAYDTVSGMIGDFVQLGTDLVDGISGAVWGGGGKLAGAMVGIVENAKNEAQSAAGIQSPSRVFAAEVGLPIVQGIGMGIREGTAGALSMLGTSMEELIGRARTPAQDFAAGMATITPPTLRAPRGLETAVREATMPAGGMGEQKIYNIDARGATDPAAVVENVKRAIDMTGRMAEIRMLTR